MRYLGCKQKIAEQITEIVKKHHKETIVDVFTGTGTMAEAFASTGMNVIACDVLSCCCILAKCKLTLPKILPQSVVEVMNDKSLCDQGFIHQTYSPHGQRKYFSEQNAMRIDAVRRYIDTLDEPEKTCALGCLLEAASQVSNTTGTFGAWCKTMDPRSNKAIEFSNCFNPRADYMKHYVFQQDAKKTLQEQAYDIAYLDPPYNTRQYGANYHVLETIARYDYPIVHGRTGLRNWEDTRSLWCCKSKVCEELENTIKSCKCDVVLLSYNNEGLMSKEVIETLLGKFGQVHVHTIVHNKYKTKAHAESKVIEYLFELQRQAIIERVLISTDEIYNMDCLVGMQSMESESVDMILCDPPFGLTECDWDKVIDINSMFREFVRLIKPDGAIVVFSQQPYTSHIVLSRKDMFKYSLVWKKSKKGNFAQAPYRFMCEHEDIVIFSKGKTAKNGKPRMKYNPQGLYACEKRMKGKTGNTEHRSGRKTQPDYVQTKTGYPSSILEFNNEGGFHPTQKPVALFEYLIKTFTNAGDVVLDGCMGSGTTAIACIQSNRQYIGFETNTEYFEKSKDRILSAKGFVASTSQPQAT